MRAYLLSAPRWLLGVIQGLFFGAGMTIFSLVTSDRDWTGAAISGLFGGVVFGCLMAPVAYRQNKAVREASGLVSPGHQRAALRASVRGPIPADPDIREAAHRIAAQQRREVLSKRPFTIVTFVAIGALNVFLAVTQSPSWWVSVILFGSLLGWQLWLPGHLARRQARLRAG